MAPIEYAGSGTARPLPQKDPRGTFRLVLDEGGPGFCQFAITPLCNAACGFCGFSRDVMPHDAGGHVPLDGALEAIDIMYRHGIRYLVLTGGEPLMHPGFISIVERARALDMNVIVVTNGSLLSEKRMREIAGAGVSGLVISIDAADHAVHEHNRGLPGVCDKIREANKLAKELKITTTASVTISRLLDLDKLPEFLESIGFSWVTFSYPLKWLGSSFLAHAENNLVDLSDDELLEAFEKVKAMKRRFKVLNPTLSLEEMQRFVKGEEQRYPCLGGWRYFFLDWKLDLWRCHYWKTPMCNIREFDGSQVVRDGCTLCMIDCYRDSSVLHHIGVSLHDSWQALRAGKPMEACSALFTKANAGSLQAVMEEFSWIIKA